MFADEVRIWTLPTRYSRRRTSGAFRTSRLPDAMSYSPIRILASPVLGGAIAVDPLHQTLLLAVHHNKTKANEQAAFVWNLMAQAGQRLMKDGKPIEAAEGNLVELERHSEIFRNKQLPILKALEIA